MSVLEFLGLILLGITFILICFLFTKMEKIKTKKWIAIVGLALLGIINIISIGLFIHKEFSSNGWSRCSTIALGVSIFILEISFSILYLGYSSSKQFKFIGLLLISILCLHCSLELANVNYLNHKIEEVKDHPQQSVDYEELKAERDKISGWSITSNILSHSFQTFTLDLDYTGTFIENGYLNKTCQKTVRVLGILLTILAPAVAVGGLLSLVTNVYPFLKLFLLFYKKKFYIFSELNNNSIITAESIRTKEYYKPVIIFTDVYTDKTNENSSELLERAKKIGAICFKMDIVVFNIPRWFLIFKKRIVIFLMDTKEEDNLKAKYDLLKIRPLKNFKCLLEKNISGKFKKNKSVTVYVFAPSFSETNEEDKKSEVTKYQIINVNIYENFVKRKLRDILINKYGEINSNKESSCRKLALLISKENKNSINNDSNQYINYFIGDQIKKYIEKLEGIDFDIKYQTISDSENIENFCFDQILIYSKNDSSTIEYLTTMVKFLDKKHKSVALRTIIENIVKKVNPRESKEEKNEPLLHYIVVDDDIGSIYDEEYKERIPVKHIASSKQLYNIENIYTETEKTIQKIDVTSTCGSNNTKEFYIGNSFEGCDYFKSVIILKSAKIIGDSCFENCKNLEYVTIKPGIKRINKHAFYNCSSLKTVIMPKSVKYIDENVFYNCNDLTIIYYGPRNRIIFKNKSDEYNLNIKYYNEDQLLKKNFQFGKIFKEKNCKINPAGLHKALVLCGPSKPGKSRTSSEENFHIRKRPRYIGYSIKPFEEKKLVNYHIFRSYRGKWKWIGYIDSTSENVILPSDIEGNNYEINQYACYNWRNLISITIPDSVTNIGEGAFKGCSSLQSITYKGTKEQWMKFNVQKPNEQCVIHCIDGDI